ncbi:hypothetical protein DYQ86_15775 [Acidobacteria bacterium AB60]|nr:hypothetical protein DYQ86_15775 [Acidobacteria bacterium AB60]
MVILVPWKPVALVLGLLSALILVSYFGSALTRGKDPFAVSTGNWQPAAIAHHDTTRLTGARKPNSRSAISEVR